MRNQARLEMTERKRRGRLTALLVMGTGLMVVLVGCGGTGTASGADPSRTVAPDATLESPANADPTAAPETISPTAAAPVSGEFCDAVAALNEVPDSDEMTPAEREQSLRIVDDLLRLWPAETKPAAERYFGEIRKAVEAGTAVDLDNTSEEFREAFAITFEYVADACPGGFG